MRKDRNAFFESSQSSSYIQPMPQNTFNPQMNQMPYQSSSNVSSFYAGAMPFNNYASNIDTNDYDTKISRLQRQMQKLESRISKLEGAINTNQSDDVNITSNMYMI